MPRARVYIPVLVLANDLAVVEPHMREVVTAAGRVVLQQLAGVPFDAMAPLFHAEVAEELRGLWPSFAEPLPANAARCCLSLELEQEQPPHPFAMARPIAHAGKPLSWESKTIDIEGPGAQVVIFPSRASAVS